MAEESAINQVKCAEIEPEDVDEKANPYEGLTITKTPPKVLSRYLRAPKGSCHDLCKYGIKHATTEAKPWSSPRKRVTTRERKTKVLEENVTSLTGTEKSGSGSNPSSLAPKVGNPNCPIDIKEVTNEEIVTSEKQFKSGSSSNPSLTPKVGNPNSPVDINEVTNEETVTSEKKSPPFEETDVSMEHNKAHSEPSHSEPSSLPVQEFTKSQTKREMVKSKSPLGSSSRKETESRSKQTGKSSTGGKEKSTPPSIPLSSKHNLKKPSSLNTKSAKNLKGVSSLKTHENVEEVKPELASNDNLPDKILHVIEPTPTNLSEEPSQAHDATKFPSASPSPSPSEEKSLKRTSKKTGKSGVSANSKKSFRPAGHATRSTASVALSHLSSGNKGKINMQHKTLGASRSPSSLSSVSSSNSSLRKQKGTTSKSNKTGQHGYQGENVKVGYKIRPKMTTIVGAANKAIPPRKLTFRRGRVIELQPQSSNNIPRRLKFRPARLLGDDIRRDIIGARKRVITNKEVNDGELNGANIKHEKQVPKHQTVEGGRNRTIVRKVGGDRSKIHGSSSKSGSEKVVLKHQSVEGKKQNPRLYNNVIEETATMLAELRKSKVKALVGAFETVISLDSPREAPPAEVSTAC